MRTVPACASLSPSCAPSAAVELANASLAAPALPWCFSATVASRKPSERSTPLAPSTTSIPCTPARVLVSTSRCASAEDDTTVAVTPAPLAALMRAAMSSSESAAVTRITAPLTRNSPETPSASERDAATPPASFSCAASASTRTRYDPSAAPGPVVTATGAAPAAARRVVGPPRRRIRQPFGRFLQRLDAAPQRGPGAGARLETRDLRLDELLGAGLDLEELVDEVLPLDPTRQPADGHQACHDSTLARLPGPGRPAWTAGS